MLSMTRDGCLRVACFAQREQRRELTSAASFEPLHQSRLGNETSSWRPVKEHLGTNMSNFHPRSCCKVSGDKHSSSHLQSVFEKAMEKSRDTSEECSALEHCTRVNHIQTRKPIRGCSCNRHFHNASLSVFFVEFWWCLKRQCAQMCTFGVLGLLCEAPAAPKPIKKPFPSPKT